MSDQQASEGRNVAMAQKRDSPNWVMIAGGAIVMAVSIVIGRKQIRSQGERAKGQTANSGGAQTANYKDSSSRGTPASSSAAHQEFKCHIYKELSEGTHSPEEAFAYDYENVPGMTTHCNGSGSPVKNQFHFQFQSSKPKRPPPTTPLPRSSKVGRHLTNDAAIPQDYGQSESYTSSALRAGLTAKREMVHRLRQQLRSRDAVLFDLQAQIADQDQVITMHRAQSADLQDCLEAISNKLFDSNREVKRLQRELMAQCARSVTNLENCNGYEMSEEGNQAMVPDVMEVVLEARKLADEVKRLEGEKQEKETASQAMSQQYGILSEKVQKLQIELTEAKTSAHRKQHVLELKKQECFKLSLAVEDLQRKLDGETKDRGWMRSSKVSRLTNARSANLRGNWSGSLEPPVSCTGQDEASSRCTDAESFHHRSGNMMRSYNSLFARSPDHQDSDGSGSKAESRSRQGPTSKQAMNQIQGIEVTDDGDNVVIDESLVVNLQQEVDQLALALATRSKAVWEKRQETSRLVTKFQKRLLKTEMGQTAMTLEPAESEECGWADLSQYLSFPSDGTSADQVQELSHKLEQVAKQQRLEEEMRELSKHQAQITDLKARVAKLTPKCTVLHPQTSQDEASKDYALRVASSILSLADKLALQEEQARDICMEVQRLSASFQLSSPYVPRSQKQELRRLLQEGGKQSECPTSGSVHQKHVLSSPSFPIAKARYVVQEQKAKGFSSRFLDRQLSSSSLQQTGSGRNHMDPGTTSLTKILDKPFQFQPGSFDPLPASRVRRGGGYGVGKSLPRKPSAHHEGGFGSRRESNPVGRSPSQQVQVSFSPEEVTSKYSFRTSAKDTQLDSITDSDGNSRGADEQAPPESTNWSSKTDVSRLQHEVQEVMLKTSAVADRYSPAFISEASSAFYGNFPSTFDTKVSSTYSPAFDGKSSPAVQVGSPTVSGSFTPCFGNSSDEQSLRRFLFSADRNSPAGASSNSCLGNLDNNTTELRKLLFHPEREKGMASNDGDVLIQSKRSTEEDSPSVKIYSNPARVNHDVDFNPESAGVSPFAARMAYLNVKQPCSPVKTLQEIEVYQAEVCDLPKEEEEDEKESLHAHWMLTEHLGRETSKEAGSIFPEHFEVLSLQGVSIKDTCEGAETGLSFGAALKETLDHSLERSVQICSTDKTLDKTTASGNKITAKSDSHS